MWPKSPSYSTGSVVTVTQVVVFGTTVNAFERIHGSSVTSSCVVRASAAQTLGVLAERGVLQASDAATRPARAMAQNLVGMGAYFAYFWTSRGASIGMMLFGFNVRDVATGQYPTMGKADLRGRLHHLHHRGYRLAVAAVGLGEASDPRQGRRHHRHNDLTGGKDMQNPPPPPPRRALTNKPAMRWIAREEAIQLRSVVE